MWFRFFVCFNTDFLMKNFHYTVYYNFNNLKIRFLELNNRQFSVDAEAFDPYSVARFLKPEQGGAGRGDVVRFD